MTKLDQLIDRAADALRTVRRLEGTKKLSYKAFLAEALTIAGCNAKRLDTLERDLNERPGTDAARQFIRRLAMALREPMFPRPHPDAGKMLRCYGTEQAESQLAQINATVTEAQALAVRHCRKRFGKDVFGEMADFDVHQTAVEEATEKLNDLYAEMREAFSGADVTVDIASLTSTERAAGLCRVFFRRAPAITPANPDWPRLLTEDFAAAVPAEPLSRKRKRSHLRDFAQAAA